MNIKPKVLQNPVDRCSAPYRFAVCYREITHEQGDMFTAIGLAWKLEGSLALSFCCSSSEFNMLTSKYNILVFCLQVSALCWPLVTVL